MLLPPGRGQQVVQPFAENTLVLRQPVSQRRVAEKLGQAQVLREPVPRAAERSPEPASAGVRVLLAEDNMVNQKVAKAMLEKLGCIVEVAIHGAQAVERFREQPYDLIVMDCQMPVMDGLQATREIRLVERDRAGPNDDPASGVPIIALTAHAMPEDRALCMDAGMNDYLSKPVRTDSLRQALLKWVPAADRLRHSA